MAIVHVAGVYQVTTKVSVRLPVNSYMKEPELVDTAVL